MKRVNQSHCKIFFIIFMLITISVTSGGIKFDNYKIIPDRWNGILYAVDECAIDKYAHFGRPRPLSAEERFYATFGMMVNIPDIKEKTLMLNNHQVDTNFKYADLIKFPGYYIVLRNDIPEPTKDAKLHSYDNYKAGKNTVKATPCRALLLRNGIIVAYVSAKQLEKEGNQLPVVDNHKKTIKYKKSESGTTEIVIYDTADYERMIHQSLLASAEPVPYGVLNEPERKMLAFLSFTSYGKYWELPKDIIDLIYKRLREKIGDFNDMLRKGVENPANQFMYEVLELHPEDRSKERIKRKPEEFEKAWVAFSAKWEAEHPDPELAPDRLEALRAKE